MYLYLFQYALLFQPSSTTASILTAVIFLVAGPAVGVLAQQTHRIVLRLIFRFYFRRVVRKSAGKGTDEATIKVAPPIPLPPKNDESKSVDERLRDNDAEYYDLRIKYASDEIAELDDVEAEYDFDVSTGFGLLVLLVAYVFHYWLQADPYTSILILAASVLFIIGAPSSFESYQLFIDRLKASDRAPPK